MAHDGMEAKIGAKKTETRNIRPVTTAVIPVLPPSGANVLGLRGKGVERVSGAMRTCDTGG